MAYPIPGPTPDLTGSEARTLRQVLGSRDESEEEMVRQSGLSRTTFFEAKRRAYERGWIEDRYMPSPGIVGVTSVSFVVARPYAEKLGDVCGEFSARKDTVLLWKADEDVLAVLFHAGPAEAGRLEGAARDGDLGLGAFHLAADARQPSVPVYFDFEAAFRHWTGLPGLGHYPRPLPQGSRLALAAKPGSRPPPVGLAGLLTRPFVSEPERPARHLLGPRRLPRSQRRLVRHGQVEWRPMPNLQHLPGFRGSRLAQVLLVRGTLKEAVGLHDLYKALLVERHAHPFLLASDARRALVGLVVARPKVGGTGPEESMETALLLDTLRPRLESIALTRMVSERIEALVSHRYDRLAPPSLGREGRHAEDPSGRRRPAATSNGDAGGIFARARFRGPGRIEQL